ncbi:hypothetical protein Tco_0139976 [Tanacetum coccineum]
MALEEMYHKNQEVKTCHTTTPPVTKLHHLSQDPTTTPSVSSAQLQAMIGRGCQCCFCSQYAGKPGLATIAIPQDTGARRNDTHHAGVSLSILHECQTVFLGVQKKGQLTPEPTTNDSGAMHWLEKLVNRMFPEEADKIERYVGGMPDPIYSSVVASKPKTMQEAIEMATVWEYVGGERLVDLMRMFVEDITDLGQRCGDSRPFRATAPSGSQESGIGSGCSQGLCSGCRSGQNQTTKFCDGGLETSRRRSNWEEVRSSKISPEVFPRIARPSTTQKVDFHIGSSTWLLAPDSMGTLSIGPHQKLKELAESTTRAFR